MNARHGVPPGYTPPVTHPPVTHGPVTCWRCHRPLTDDSTTTQVISVGGRDVRAHTSRVVECVPTYGPAGPGVVIPPTEETP